MKSRVFSLRFLSIIFLTLILLFTIILTACKKPVDDPNDGGTPIIPTDNFDATAIEVIDKILAGAYATTKVDSDAFNIKAESRLVIPKTGEDPLILDLLVHLSLDLDVSKKDSTNNTYLIELTQLKEDVKVPIINLYYKDDLTKTPYIYANFAGSKHAIKAVSLKKILLNGVPGLLDPYTPTANNDNESPWNFEGIVQSILEGIQVSSDISIELIKPFVNGLFQKGYINTKKWEAGFVVSAEGLNGLLELAMPILTSELGNDANIILKTLGIDLTFQEIVDVITNLPDYEIKIDVSFDNSWVLKQIKVNTYLKDGFEFGVNSLNGNEIIDIDIPSNSTVSFELSNLDVNVGAPSLTILPDGVDLINYTPHNLINFELTGVARLEYLNEINDGEEIWNAAKNYKFTIKSDLDPFALLNGIDSINLEESIRRLGKFNVLVTEETDTATNIIAEIAFDPANSGDDGLYLNVTLQGIGALAGAQTVKFDISDLIEYLFDSPSYTENLPQNAEETTSSSGFKFGMISSILNSYGFKVHSKSQFANFGYSIELRRIKELAQYVDLLLGYSGERLFVGFDSIKYGSVKSDFNAFENFKNTTSYPVSITPHESVMTVYEYGQSFQDGYSTIDMEVLYSVKGVIDSTPTRKSLNVIKMRGFDPLKVGEQTVELYLIIPPKTSSIMNANLAIYNEFASANLPYGLIKYTYKIVVNESAKNVSYALANDYGLVGDNIYDARIIARDGGVSTTIKVESFKLFEDKNLTFESSAINDSGTLTNVGKFWIKITTTTNDIIMQPFYISELILPNISEKLIYGDPVTNLNAIARYYDEETDTIKSEYIKAVQNTKITSFIDINGETIKGNGLKPNIGGDSSSSIKWTYTIATQNKNETRETSLSGLRVKFNTPVLNVVAITTSLITYEDLRLSNVGSILRSDGIDSYHVDTSNKNGLRWVNGEYVVSDALGNIIAKKVKIVIKETTSQEIVTETYYNAETGRFKIKRDESGNPIYYGNASKEGLTIEITFEYDNLSATATTKLTLYPKYRTTATNKLNIKQYNPLPYSAFSIYALNNITNSVDSSSQIKHDPSIGYYVKIGSEIYTITTTFYEKDTTNVIENALTNDGRIALDVGVYTADLTVTIDGIVIKSTHTITVNAANEFKAKIGEQISETKSLHYADPDAHTMQTSGKIYFKEDGYVFEASSSKFIIKIPYSEIKLYDENNNLVKTSDMFDEDGKIIGEVGKYKITFTLKYSESHVFYIEGYLIIS
ncbi:MAG: hypothetical protein LBF12_02010 [Christensenellaceae bacterium]|jgi:hypothetical protein|nr:hypothetical protein [Christensenellaceae bacterium]